MFTDYHIHTPLCHHAVGHPCEYVKVAKDRRLEEIGFADHNPMPDQFDDWRMGPDELPEYLKLVDEAREAYPDFPIRIGLECDYLDDYEDHVRKLDQAYDWDYLIGSVHYISDKWDVDNPMKMSKWDEMPVEEIWTLYFAQYTKMACSGLFDFLGHADLVKKFGRYPKGELKHFYKETLDAIRDHDVAIELNTAGLYKDTGEIYPSREFLEEAFCREIPVLINSDAHRPEEVGRDFDKALKLVHEIGYKELQRFVKRERKSVSIEDI
ncbi:MAG: histidinol-phosphatase HisJ family protein [Verrucomicrobiota bacterium]